MGEWGEKLTNKIINSMKFYKLRREREERQRREREKRERERRERDTEKRDREERQRYRRLGGRKERSIISNAYQ